MAIPNASELAENARLMHRWWELKTVPPLWKIIWGFL